MAVPYPDNNNSNDNTASYDISRLSAEHTNLYSRIQQGLNDITLGNTRPFAEAMTDVKVKRAK